MSNRAPNRASIDEVTKVVKREGDTCTDEDEGSTVHVAYPAKRVGPARLCQAERCEADLGEAKQYHRRHRVCERHSKAQVVLVGGITQRFCQQCSRFHELAEFDDAKRSCRRRLAGHNERRRKSAAEAHVEGSGLKGASGGKLKDLVCGKVNERGRIQIPIQDSASYKHFHI